MHLLHLNFRARLDIHLIMVYDLLEDQLSKVSLHNVTMFCKSWFTLATEAMKMKSQAGWNRKKVLILLTPILSSFRLWFRFLFLIYTGS